MKLPKYVIEFIGRSLGNTSAQLEGKVEERLKKLYEWRQTQAEESKDYEELEGFCWWVASDNIDGEWTLNKFHELLNALDRLDDLYFAARQLGNYFDINPTKVLNCLSMMVDKLKPQQGMYFNWDDKAQDMLTRAILNNDVKEQAIELIHKFGSKGFLQYRDLLAASLFKE